MRKDGKGRGGVYVCTSFSSLPKDLIAEFAREAQSRKVYPRDLFSDAVMLLCQQREQVEITYLVPRSGGVKKNHLAIRKSFGNRS